MISADRLEPQDWMTAPETRALVAALTADGAELRFVGGCVRDALAERPVTDVDLATPEPPARVVALLERAGINPGFQQLDTVVVTDRTGHSGIVGEQIRAKRIGSRTNGADF